MGSRRAAPFVIVVALLACGREAFEFPLDSAKDGGAADGSVAPSCTTDETSCAGACTRVVDDPANCGGCDVTCRADQLCAARSCRCPDGKTTCGDACVVLESDPLHCGRCDVVCTGSTPVCDLGQCRPACTGGRSACAGACVDTKSDPDHCGDCTVACGPGVLCQKSTCACAAGSQLCGKRCVDTSSDRTNCGVCGRGCPQSSICGNGICQPE